MLESAAGISDLLFAVGKPPIVEQHGGLEEFPVDLPPDGTLTETHIGDIAACLMNGQERLVSDLTVNGSCDCSYSVEGVARFRVNIFRQNGHTAIVMRKLATKIPTLEALGLPEIFGEMVREKNGIIFVTGSTGSGKTTTLAAMLNELNRTQRIHILTLEDPIEFLHPHQQALFNQRELGKDFSTFAAGLRAALRQAPKAILVGEIRDRETMEIAMTAAETGHIVFSTLHTINAGQTINRILGMFTKDEEQQLRQRLADTLRFVVSQRLVNKIGGGRLMVSEIMGSSLRTRETLLYGERENSSFQEIIEAGCTMGWHSFDQSLLKAYKEDVITDETALIFCQHKNKMRRDIDMLKKLRDQLHDEPSGLTLEMSPGHK
ncbi:MAG: Twitching motility protein PilT [uncultured Chthoniobacterales bacterium]|uniref:Twitching motility protein PilT n=1 Tax=uncultured Chthoniobacterales bacterium TaxID=1836801 RepID=A0A6J4HE69_9BACT|nr:MAG: Twitching motility protein PilT [uncultured Chthoniobacterales bacterium]